MGVGKIIEWRGLGILRRSGGLGLQFTMSLEVLLLELDLEGLDIGVEIDGLIVLELGFPDKDESDALDEEVDEVDFGIAKAIGVGDIPLAFSVGGGIDAGGAASLQLHLGQDLLEVVAGGELGDLDDGAGAEASSQVGGARQDEAQMLVVHEILAILRQSFLDGFCGVGETGEDRVDVVTLLHGHDAHLILFVDPCEEILGLVAEDATGVGPVAPATGGKKEGGVWLLEEVAVAAELLLLFEGHSVGVVTGGIALVAMERQVFTLQFALELDEAFHNRFLDLAALIESGGRRQAGAADGSAGTAARSSDIFSGGVDLGGGDFVRVHVADVLGVGGVAVVAARDDGIKQLFE